MRQIVTTHLDPDHSGGLPDFPEAEVHIFGRELDAALHPSLRDRPRYLGVHWKHSPRWVRHDAEGDDWFGFEGVRILPDLGTEVLMVPLIGHTLGHTGIAIKRDDGWLLHCGDAYFHHNEIATPPSCPPGLRFFQNLNNADRRQRLANQERLRELAPGTATRCSCSARTTRTSSTSRRRAQPTPRRRERRRRPRSSGSRPPSWSSAPA